MRGIAFEKPEAEPQTDNGWSRIETAPQDGTIVLLGFCDVPGDSSSWCSAEGWYEAGPADRCWYDVFNERIRPTHWRPRLTPPKSIFAVEKVETL